MKVKICGIKTLSAAKAAAKAAADFLGLNFVPTSKRCISEETAKEIIAELRGPRPVARKVRFTGVFQNQSIELVNGIADRLDLDFVQLHGDESPEYCARVNTPVIKAFSLESDFDAQAVMKEMEPYRRAHYFLLDRKKKGITERERGNTDASTPNVDAMLHFKKVATIAEEFSVMLAGGLTPENVREAVKASGRIDGVDVAGGVETNGEKDPQKIKDFIKATKQ